MTAAAISRCCLLALSLAATIPGDRAWAAGNRLLPFWAQPYPYGYADRTAERDLLEPCTNWGRHGHALKRRRCLVVLHARD